MKEQTPADRLYALIANEEDARLCEDIPESACQVVPGNFLRILLSLVLTRVGDLLASPKIVLPWLLQGVGAPAAVIGWLVPIRESGSLIPQLAIGAWVRQRARRAGLWSMGSLGQAACVLGMAVAAWNWSGVHAATAVICLLILFSLFRGLCSVAMKDVQGKCVPKARRGRLNGLASTAAGLLVAALSLLLFAGTTEPGLIFQVALLVGATLLWLAAAGVFHGVKEFAGETEGGRSVFTEIRSSTALMQRDRHLQQFVMTRALLMCSALSAPFIVVLAQQGTATLSLLGAFLLVSSLASAVSASVWGWMADVSSRRVMNRGGVLAALASLTAVSAHTLFPDWDGLATLLVAGYFLLSIGHAGVRIGRKTYLVDMAGGNRRTQYVAVSNSVIGFLLLIMGGVTSLTAMVSPGAALLLLGCMGAAGAWSAARLPEV